MNKTELVAAIAENAELSKKELKAKRKTPYRRQTIYNGKGHGILHLYHQTAKS